MQLRKSGLCLAGPRDRGPCQEELFPDAFLGFQTWRGKQRGVFLCQTQPELARFLWKQGNSLVMKVPGSAKLGASTNTLWRLLAPFPQVLCFCQRREDGFSVSPLQNKMLSS